MAPKEEDFANIGDAVGTGTIAPPKGGELKCDYLVVGAGTAGMSFVDTMLTEHPSSTIILVDRNSQPGGHWTHAYPYARLHQPSCYYGVNSLKLGKNLDSKGNERYDVNDRATGAEILDYYKRACDKFVASGRVRCFFDADHEFDETTGVNTIVVCGTKSGSDVPNNNSNRDVDESSSNNNSNIIFSVKCHKLVTVATNVTVPSMRKPLIPVHESVSASFVPPNEVPSRAKSGNYNNYVVFGNGKSGVDAITHLLFHEGIDQSQITWIVSRDVWYMLRDFLQDYFRAFNTFGKTLTSAKSVEDWFLNLEEDGAFGRIDPNRPCPEVFKGALLGANEFEAVKSIQNVVRMGRATSIESNRILLENGSLEFSPPNTLLVDCMVDNTYGYVFAEDFQIFEPGRINLGPLLSFVNPSRSSATIAFHECAFGGYDGDDSQKNGCCYFLRGKHAEPLPESMIGMFYMDFRSADALMKVKGGSNFLTNSRTCDFNPTHHKRGRLRFLWIMYGPSQFHKMGPKLFQKVESKGYSDIDHCFGIETLNSERAQLKEKKNKTSCFRGLRRFRKNRGAAIPKSGHA
jgi:hypothetical protein